MLEAELHVERAERLGAQEHLRLQRGGAVSGRLAAGGRVEGEDQPPAPFGGLYGGVAAAFGKAL